MEKNKETQTVERASDRRVRSPRSDIYETEKEVVLVTEMPGVDENSLNITLEKDVLVLEGRAEKPELSQGEKTVYAEFDVGDFRRAFTLGSEIDRDAIQATLRHGILRLVLPKVAPATRRITVKAG